VGLILLHVIEGFLAVTSLLLMAGHMADGSGERGTGRDVVAAAVWAVVFVLVDFHP
jgi:hypothetical protein